MTRRTILLVGAASAVLGCRPTPNDQPSAGGAAAATASVDSIVLERTRCFGFCPAYRLRVSGAGQVFFQSRNPDDTTRVASDSVPADVVRGLVAQAERLGFDSLPDIVAEDKQLCPNMATDHSSVIVTLFRPARAKRVHDYLGCRAESEGPRAGVVARLRAFEQAIDSLTGSSRWVRPATRR